jgi:hypothetical protein
VNRTLRRSARPFIVFAVLFGSFSLLALCNYFLHGRHAASLQSALLFLGLYIVVLALISSVNVSVSDAGLTITRWYVAKRFIPFSEVDHSDVQFLAERDWPVQIKIHAKRRLLGQLGLKAIQRVDAVWLCSLPQLKCTTHPGLTRRT